ncbi:MAG: recombinase family protein [Acidaminococcaceae bacterium]|nr:recombinase family protein [Acidaminococcaceae bacterium]
MLRAAIYARFSSDNQRHESIETQYHICENYSRQKGYAVVAHYKDEAKTGTTAVGRDGFQQMLDDARRDIFDVLVIYTLDRAARQELDYYLYKKQLLAAGIRYEYATESFDPATVDGQFFEGIQVAQAAWYSRKLSVKVKDGKDTNARKFLFPGGTPPLGYDATPDHHYVINEQEAAAVRLIFRMYNDGHGYGPIMEELNRQGFKTKRGGRFGRNSLHEILSNEKYCGTYVHRRSIDGQRRKQGALSGTPNAIPAIISQEVFNAAAERRERNRHNTGSYSAKIVYLLTGKVVCGECGHRYTGNSYRCRQYRYEYYQCSEQMNKGKDACANPRVKKDWLERSVVDAITQLLTLEHINTIIDKAMARYQEMAAAVPDEADRLRKQKAGAEQRLANLYKIMEATGQPDEFDLERMKAIKNKIRVLNEQIAQTDTRQKIMITRDQVKRYWYRLMADLKMQKKPEIIRPLLQKIITEIKVFPDRVVVGIGNMSLNQGLYTGAIGAASKPLIELSLHKPAA